MTRTRLAILTTHPIQYQAPWFRALAARRDLDIKVFFCHEATPKEQAAAGFGVEFAWDMPLLDGYPYQFLENVATRPNLGTFAGLDTPEVKNVIARKEYDAWLLCGWNYKSAWQAMRGCWQTGTPVMVRGDSNLHTPRHLLKRMLKWPVYRWLMPRFDACLAVGKWSEEYYLHYGVRRERVFFVPHTIDHSYFAQESRRLIPQRCELRKGWGLDNEAVVFLFAGKFIEKKRPMDFVRAVERAIRNRANVAGLMVGDGPLRQECENYVRLHKVPVCFTGFLNQSQIVRSYTAADALVLPSDGGETWGLVVNEAMSCGLPAILSDRVGSGPDLVKHGKTGAIFPLGDIRALAEVMAMYAKNFSSLKENGYNARQHIEGYSIRAAADNTVAAVMTMSGLGLNEPSAISVEGR